MYSAGSVATIVFTRMTGISSTISGNMVSLASGAIIDIGQAVGQTLSCDNVPEKYFNAAVNLTALYARVAMDGGACSFNMGGISLSKGVSPQAEFFKQEVERALKRKPVLFQKVFS
jgi:hypothetical protein